MFIAFQFWVLGMSVVALLNESIPHILASLVTHVVATAWGSFQLVHTANFRSQFVTLITKGACKDASQIPITSNYWEDRRAAEVSSLTLNVLALVVSCFLSWRLFKASIPGTSWDCVSEPLIALWLADFQARWCISCYQQDVQTCSHTIDYHPTEPLLHGCHRFFVVGSFDFQCHWGSRRSAQSLSGVLYNYPYSKYPTHTRYLLHLIISQLLVPWLMMVCNSCSSVHNLFKVSCATGLVRCQT